MVKIIIDDGPKCVRVSGDLLTAVADISYAVGTIYTNLRRHNAEAAELFRAAMVQAMMPDSPVWEVQPEGTSIVFATKK